MSALRRIAEPPLTFLALAAMALAASGAARAQDISNPQRLMFVADAVEPLIDVVDLFENEVVYRIETAHVADHVVATPHAPILVHVNIERRLVSLYDLSSKELAREVELPIVPRHMVLDTTGSRIGFTDDVDGGFVLFSAYAGTIVFTLEDFPPTGDVLFDPNEVDIYYSNSRDGAIGLIDTNVRRTLEIEIAEPGQPLSSPSRSLDARYVYVANEETGEINSLNAFSRVIYQSFLIGASPARPYTTPEGSFLYMMDRDTGRFMSVEQSRFEVYDDRVIGEGIDLVTVGRFDRLNLLASTTNNRYYIYDNLLRSVIDSGNFPHTPLTAQGAADGRTAYVSFQGSPQVAVIDLERQEMTYIAAAATGIGAASIGLSNNVCH